MIERRIDYAKRKRVSEMSLEEMRQALLVSEKTGLSVLPACIRNSAYDYLLKPFDRQQLLNSIRRALENRCLNLANGALKMKFAKVLKEKSRVRRVRK
jgi:DNA-binding NtrC family response regulator